MSVNPATTDVTPAAKFAKEDRSLSLACPLRSLSVPVIIHAAHRLEMSDEITLKGKLLGRTAFIKMGV
jgi:hypothetical protein